jgi:hypothetical protein
MDPERRLELIAMLAQNEALEAIVLIGRELLDTYYPANVFNGSSGDLGPEYIVALRRALSRLDDRSEHS